MVETRASLLRYVAFDLIVRGMFKKCSEPSTLGFQGKLTITFQYNLPSRQCTYPISVRAFLSLQNRWHFPGSPSTRLLPLWRLHCFYTVYLEDRILVLGTDRSQTESYQEKMENEEFQIHILSQQSLQLVTCGQGRCSARAEHHEAVFLVSLV